MSLSFQRGPGIVLNVNNCICSDYFNYSQKYSSVRSDKIKSDKIKRAIIIIVDWVSMKF